MTTPTALKLRIARVNAGLSQEALAVLLRQYGAPAASKRTVQRWEAGAQPRGHYTRALAAALGMPHDDLVGAVVQDADGARHVRVGAPFTPPAESGDAAAGDGRLPGIWLCRYQYWSTGRSGLFISQYHTILTLDGIDVTVTSLPPGSIPAMKMRLHLQRDILTGVFEEHTDTSGHYLGDVRWGAVQLIMAPSRRYMNGKWVAWGSGQVVNSGPWELIWLTADTADEVVARHSQPLPDEPVG